MRKAAFFLAGAIVLAWLLAPEMDACTAFCLKGDRRHPVFGRNFDFMAGQGQVHVNLRDQQKRAFNPGAEQPFAWVSRYGSVSFNQNGREFPYDGINEAGLVVTMMMNESASSRYPDPDGRSGLTELQWIQYQLDVSASVADVIASDRVVRVSSASIAPLHFLVADAAGDVAAIEYLDGRTVVHRGKGLPVPALANDPYDVSLESKRRADAAGVATDSAGDRFTQAARLVAAYGKKGGPAVTYAFEVLETVTRGGTQWSIVYDIQNRAVHYRTRGNAAIRRLGLAQFDFSCSDARPFIDIEETANDAAHFRRSDSESNLRLIDAVWDGVAFLKPLPRELRLAMARHAGSVACAKGTQASRNRAGPDSGHGLGEPARWTHPIPSLPRESPPSRPTPRRQAPSR
jgi:choloylglycine hydrolase